MALFDREIHKADATPFNYAVLEGRTDDAYRISQNGGARQIDLDKGLIFASQRGFEDMAELLIALGADIRFEGVLPGMMKLRTLTALQAATERNFTGIVALIEKEMEQPGSAKAALKRKRTEKAQLEKPVKLVKKIRLRPE